jgi:lysophospholipase L1-like esterase
MVVLAGDALAPAAREMRVVHAAATSSARPRYLALGDSLAAGMQPDSSGRDPPTSEGYVDLLARALPRERPGLRPLTLSCGGATTTTLLQGGASCQPRGEPGQVERAERFLAKHRDVTLVTIDIGDNDVEPCINPGNGDVDDACVQHGLARLRRNLPVIARRLRAAAGPATKVVGLVDYDQFLSVWLKGTAGQAAARRSVSVVRSLNTLATRIYRRAGLIVADAGARFATEDFAHQRELPGVGMVPLAVYRICTLTWACGGPGPIGYDDHARAGGYAELAAAILDAVDADKRGGRASPG